MRLELSKVWDEAIRDHNSANLNSPVEDARIRYGIKIVNTNKDIFIYNTSFGGDYYNEVTLEQYLSFQKNGWKLGCYLIAKENYLNKLDKVEYRIREEVNNRKSERVIQKLKSERSRIMEKYTNIILKINKWQ
jgi:hypothetical protein